MMNRRVRRCFLRPAVLLACFIGPACRPGGRGFLLVRSGKPVCAIVLPSPAGEHERRAAEILAAAVQKMSGARLPIVEKNAPASPGDFAIGVSPDSLRPEMKSAAANLGEDGFLIRMEDGAAEIISGGHKGAIYGAVHLLEKYFGCRKFGPAAEIFPRRKTLRLPSLVETDRPVNAFRVVNGEHLRDPDYRDWLRLDAVEDIFARGYYVHTFNRLVPWEEHFARHPEYFALMNGKRIIDQPCLTRPEAYDLAVAKLAAEMAAQPDKKYWSVSQNDNFSYCRCPACERVIAEEGSPAGPVIRFVNRIAARFPDKIISTLAYQYSRPAPRRTRPAPNVQIMLCTIELNRSRPIAEDPAGADFAKDIADWRGLTENLYLWDYTVNFSHHVSPFPNLHVLGPNIRFFVRSGARFHFQQTNAAAGHEFSELKTWLIARLLWNPEADERAVLRDFVEAYYGGGAPQIQAYIDGLASALRTSGAALDIYEPPTNHDRGYLAEAEIARFERFFNEAEAAAAEPVIKERIRTARLPLRYAEFEIGKSDLFGRRGFYQDVGGRFEPRTEMLRRVEEFAANCERNGVRTLNEAGLTPAEYVRALRRFIDVQIEGNKAFRAAVAAVPPPAAKYGRGDLSLLTNGVRGANDFKVHWLGWEGLDFELVLDLGSPGPVREISLSTLYDPKSWILHPARVTAAVSKDGSSYRDIGSIAVAGNQRREDVTRTFGWEGSFDAVRFVRFRVVGTKALPAWHPSAGGRSWVFVDEIVVR